MSEDPGAVAPQPEADVPAATDGRRGRPRPQATKDRDEAVRELLANNGAMTRSAIAEKLGWESTQAYASLWRLRHYEQAVEKVDGKSEWQLTGSTPAPPSE
jgi:hypothetical protein